MEIVDMIKNSLQGFIDQLGTSLPYLINALIILVIGWFIAKMVKWAIQKLLRLMKFDDLIEKTQIDETLAKGGIRTRMSGILSSLAYWAIMLVVLTAFFNKLGLQEVSQLITDMWGYIPRIVVGLILLVIGMYGANFIKTVVTASLKANDFQNADFMGSLAKGVTLFFVFSLVLSHLGIGTELITRTIPILIGALGLALGLAFGLGGKEWASDMVNKHLRK